MDKHWSGKMFRLGRLPGHVRRPGYDRTRVRPGIVLLGGAFHRAHQAVVIDDLLAAGATDWGIIGASLRSSDTYDALAPQDCLYTVAVRSGAGTEHRIVGSVLETYHLDIVLEAGVDELPIIADSDIIDQDVDPAESLGCPHSLERSPA